jgi:hypothetical protein
VTLDEALAWEREGRGILLVNERSGRAAVQFPVASLVTALEQERAQGRPGQIANRPAHSDLVILDELGYLPFRLSPSFGEWLTRLPSGGRILGDQSVARGREGRPSWNSRDARPVRRFPLPQ